MEKLMKLLEEYLNSAVFKKDISGDDNVEDIPDVKLIRYFTDRFYCTYISDTKFEILADTVISKRYGFIEWLVENDKIDENKIEIHWFSFYESVLMELAIQDEPIDFLISILM